MTREEKQKAIDALKISAPIMIMTEEKFNDYIQTLNKTMDWLEQEPTTKNNLGVDCISRTRAIERLKLNFPISQGADNSRDRHRYMQALADLQAIKELPSVTPQEPIKKLEKQIKQLQNRCYAFTHGQICVFCLNECEHKTESEPQESEDEK